MQYLGDHCFMNKINKMKTGFYNLKNLSEEQLRAFFTDAVMLSYDSHVDILDCNVSFAREVATGKTIKEMLEGVSLERHNVCINRQIQRQKSDYAEIGYSTLGDPSYFLYCFLSLGNLNILAEKYSLIME